MFLNLLLLHWFNGLFSTTTWISHYQKGKTSLDSNDTRDGGVLGCSSISWTICKQSAPRSRQTTTPTPHHSIFTDWMLFLTPNQQCQSTEFNVEQIAAILTANSFVTAATSRVRLKISTTHWLFPILYSGLASSWGAQWMIKKWWHHIAHNG